MTYNSVYFVAFFLVFLLVISLMPGTRSRQAVLFAANLFFYLSAGNLSCLVILFASFAVTYYAALGIGRIYASYDEERAGLTAKEAALLLGSYKKRAFKILLPALIFVFGILVFVKAGRLLSFEEVFSFRDFGFSKVLIPLGISYYTFSAAGYMLDVYWRKTKPKKNGFLLAVCMTNFMTIVQGPIMKYDRLIRQLEDLPGFSYERMAGGLSLMLWGFMKKMIVADRLSIYYTTVFGKLSRYAGIEVILAVLANVLCIYADFSGCMDIVKGAGECIGLTLDDNFRQPFFSKSAAEFWRRWHITLGQWFRDYVYMPIAMSPRFMKMGFAIRKRYGPKASQITSTALPLMVVWILTGIWHGTGWGYFIWGIYWGGLIIMAEVLKPWFEKITSFFGIDRDSSWYQIFQMARTFCLFAAGRMLTAMSSPKGVVWISRRIIAELRLWRLFDGGLYNMGLDQSNFRLALFGVLLIWIVDILQSRMRVRDFIGRQPLVIRWLLFYTGIAAVVIFGIYGSAYDASSFIYGAF